MYSKSKVLVAIATHETLYAFTSDTAKQLRITDNWMNNHSECSIIHTESDNNIVSHTLSMRHSVPANMNPTSPKFFA